MTEPDHVTLRREADRVRLDLTLDSVLGRLGEVHLVGSAALDLMVRRDLDLTVICDRLDVVTLFDAARPLAAHPNVRRLSFVNDTGPWNVDPSYPDGIYWGIDCRVDGRAWNIDIWFVDEPDRQPDLRHVRELPARLTDETRSAILAIKRACHAEPHERVPSHEIYTAVLDRGIRTPDDFDRYRAT
jgi:hypothetical protein